MIELKSDKLVASFPELPFAPKLTIDFQRTLRIPDDGRDYPLPPGLGSFPLRHIDDYSDNIPGPWLQRGGVLLPMWQTEAMWLSFDSVNVAGRGEYPFAVKIATGKINAVSGEGWQKGLSRNPQDYIVVPEQPWLDGYCVEKGIIRQFVAMPLGQGYSAEEQISGEAEFGGLQIEVFPMRTEIFIERFPKIKPIRLGAPPIEFCLAEAGAMGLAPGGRMRQEIFDDPYSIHDWDTQHSSRCFIHLVNSAAWQAITRSNPPSKPPTAKQYTEAGYPWFDYYDAELKAINGSSVLASLKSINQKSQEMRQVLSGNASVPVTNTINLRAGLRPNQVREAQF